MSSSIRRQGRGRPGRVLILTAVFLAIVLALAVRPGFPGDRSLSGQGSTDPGGWKVWSGSSFDLVYDPAVTKDPAPVAAALESAGRNAAAFLGRPWPLPPSEGHPVSDPSLRPVFLAGLRVDPSSPSVAGYTRVLDPDSPGSVREAAAALVLAHTAGRRVVSEALTVGLAYRIDPGVLPAEAWAVALAGESRLASLPQLLRWWPSLPLGNQQLGCLVGFIATRWGGEGLAALAGRSPENFSRLSWLDHVCEAALGARLAEVDRDWVAYVDSLAGSLQPSTLEQARASVDRQLQRTRLGAVLLATLSATFFAWSAAALSPRRRETAWALLAFGAAAAVELVLFTGSLPASLKSLVALTEVLLFIGFLAVAGRRAVRAETRERGEPRTRDGKEIRDDEAVLGPGAGRALLAAVALSLAVMAPRFGLYYYCREIWAKAPMIVLVLAIVYLVERRGVSSVGLGRLSIGRLIAVAAAGIVAFRLTTGLTEVLFASLFSTVTGPAFAWYVYEPWWRAVGFEHYPFVAWPAWFPALDIGDLLFGNFAEEIFFRGYLLTRLERSMGWWKALFAQALLFGVFHINYDLFPFYPLPLVMYVLMATVFGVLMGLLLKYSGTLIVPALIHPMANLGVLWVGVTTTTSGMTWLTLPVYYALQLALGLILIPLVMRAVTGRFGPPLGPESRRRSPRVIGKAWVEAWRP